MLTDDSKTVDLYGTHARDAGKRFEVREVDPLTMSGYVLRLVSALRVPNFETVQALFARGEDDAPADESINAILRILQGADPVAVHALVSEALQYVRIAPDPQHPEAWRALMSTDIRELRTLGEVLVAFIKLHFDTGS